MALEEYHKKRDFSKTIEPKNSTTSKKKIFVIQKHRASHLHYDFRIEHKGALKSWAVPKGPSTDPSVKRLAMMTEDHPLDYADFEGTIPEGQYGAGKVIVWDTGTYENLSDKNITDGLEEGHIKFRLNGNKLKGAFSMVRMREKQWLLTKMKDEFINTKYDDNSSVLSNKTLD